MSSLKKDIEDTGERLIPREHRQSLAYGEHMARYSSVLDIAKDKVVLDIASGTGYGSNMISYFAREVIGIDISEEAIEYSKSNYNKKNIEFICGSAYNIPLKDNSIDVVVSLETIEHLDKPEVFVKEVKRVLKKDGIFIVSTPNDDQFVEGNVFHVHQFQLPELKKITEANFNNIKYFYQLSYYSTALINENNLESDNAIIDKSTKSFSQKKEDAMYYLAVCSDGDISENNLVENCYLPDSFSEKVGIELSQEINNRIDALNLTIDKLNTTLEAERAATREKNDFINEIVNSKRYKIANIVANNKNKII